MESLLGGAIVLRPLVAADEAILWEMVYYAIFVPEHASPPPRQLVNHPRIAKYVRGWGRDGDLGFAALDYVPGRPIGAVWTRLLQGPDAGYGHVSDSVPELTIALLPGYRGQGIGTVLLTRLCEAARVLYPAISLSVARDNPARRLYERLGFIVVKESNLSLTMVKQWYTA